VDAGDPRPRGGPSRRGREHHPRRTVTVAEDLDVAEAEPYDAGAQRLGDRLLGGEPSREARGPASPRALRAVRLLGLGEQPVDQRRGPRERELDAVDLDRVDADAHDGHRVVATRP
jgi:hypothetical protein